MKYNPFTRRMFLQGVGQSALLLPFLPSLAPERALAQAAARQRFIFMGHFYGRDIDYWYPTSAPTLISPEGIRHAKLSDISGSISPTFGPAFDGLKNKISILRGLDSLDPDNGHTWSQPLTASGTNPSVNFGYSLDAVLEESKKFNATMTKVGALRTSPNGWAGFSFTSKSSLGQMIPTEPNPSAIYDRYFNPVTIAANQGNVNRKQTVSNLVMEDFKRVLNSSKIGMDDKRRLDNYMTLLTSVEARLGLNIPSCRSMGPGTLTSNSGYHSAMIDLEVAALACGLTNIVVHGIPQVSDDPRDHDLAHHGAAHENGSRQASDGSGQSQHAVYDRWVMARVAEMLKKLDAIDDGGGKTLLDNSFFLYSNSESRGFHVHYDMPVVVAGGQDQFRLGYYMDYRAYPLNAFDGGKQIYLGRPYNDLLVTFFKAMGLVEEDYQKFGQVGFGTYSNFDQRAKDHYRPFLDRRNSGLPFLWKAA